MAHRTPPHRLLALLLVLLLVPTARAEPACADVTEQPANLLGIYVLLPALEIWLESNTVPGLQRQPCMRDDGSIAQPDTFLIDLAAMLA